MRSLFSPAVLRRCLVPTLIAIGTLGACSKHSETPAAGVSLAPAASAPATTVQPAAIAWRHAANAADVDAAFAAARTEAKPLLVYWGATWCPPCNQLKATLFNRQDFIERTRAFVPVYIDGDSAGAQALGNRFQVRGYPTMVLFNALGTELTRLPGEVDAAQYSQMLTLGMNAKRPVKSVLADARSVGGRLDANDWKMLAFYAWDTDEQHALPHDQLAPALAQLAAACPVDLIAVKTRLMLKAAIAAADDKERPPVADAAALQRLLVVLADADAARAQMDVLTNWAADLVGGLTADASPQRRELLTAFDMALAGLQADGTLSRADRVGALTARIDLAKLGAGTRAAAASSPAAVPTALQNDARALAEQMDREIDNGYERQAVITAAASMLEDAGLADASDALLQANLAKSHSPYYLMSELAANAGKRHDAAGALRWSQAAFDAAAGPATRLQWGASYVRMLVEMAPSDEARIEGAARAVFDEAAANEGAFDGRNARSLQRVGGQLRVWNADGQHAAAVQRLQARLGAVCSRLALADPQRAVCSAVFRPAAAAKSA